MLFLELPAPGAQELGNWLLSFALVLVIADRVRAIFWPHKPAKEAFVTKDDVDKLQGDHAVALDKLKTEHMSALRELKLEVERNLTQFVTRLEWRQLEQQIAQLNVDQRELAKSTLARYEQLNTTTVDMRVAVEALRGDLRRYLDLQTSLVEELRKKKE